MMHSGTLFSECRRSRKTGNVIKQTQFKLMKKDCLDCLKSLPDNTIDVTMTSPPYNKKEAGAIIVKKVIYNKYKDAKPESEYQQWQVEVLNALYEKTKAGGSCFYNHRPRWEKGNPIHPFQWLSKTRWQMRQQIIWNRKICGNLRSWRFFQTHEEVWWLWKPNGKSPGKNQVKSGLGKLGSVWDIRPYSNKALDHPCMFPPELPAIAILGTTGIGDIVFDPYCGMGTTGVAATTLGRYFVGCDIDNDYLSHAKNRIKAAHSGDFAKVHKYLPHGDKELSAIKKFIQSHPGIKHRLEAQR